MLREMKRRWRLGRVMAELEGRRRSPPVARPHALPHPLIVSLTSYPGRFATLAMTLDSLLLQTIRADATILWLARGDEDQLPPDVLALRQRGLTIATAPDWRSYKKIVPARAAYPEASVATADDDLGYPADWLERLVEAAEPGEVVCHRAHRIELDGGGVRPYKRWDRNLRAPERGPRILPTGVGGVLYPPGSLPDEALDPGLFLELAPTADDVWLWWMHRRAGRVARKIGGAVRVLEWPGSQAEALQAGNVQEGGGNDRAVAALLARYGLPLA